MTDETNIAGFRPLVFICSPFAGDTKRNIENARRYSRFAVQERYVPIAPHLLFPQFLDDTEPQERRLGLHFGMVLMAKCSEVWVFGRQTTAGMAEEIEKARMLGLVIRRFDICCREEIADGFPKGTD